MALLCCAAEYEMYRIIELDPASRSIHHMIEQNRIPKAGKIILQRLDTHHEYFHRHSEFSFMTIRKEHILNN